MVKKIKEISKGKIILYKNNVEVCLDNKTVWLTQPQIADLFGTKRPAITKHLSNIFNSNELSQNSACSILEYTAVDGTHGNAAINLEKLYR